MVSAENDAESKNVFHTVCGERDIGVVAQGHYDKYSRLYIVAQELRVSLIA